MATITNSALESLKATIRGRVLTAGDPGYDEARTLWNAMIDRHPALIVRCAGVSDIRHAVRFASDNGLPLAIRGGGHNIAGSAVCDDGLVADLSPMRSVRIDPTAHRAYVEPGVTLGDFDHEAQAFGLATPLGINSTTGVAGLTLGGGMGWLSRRYGLSADNLLSVDVITAQGELVHATDGEHADLFWALRGGGGNFGVATLFEFGLHPVGPDIFGGLIVLPIEQARTALARYRTAVDAMPDELSVWVVMRPAPALPFLPADVHGKPIIAFAICFTGPIEQGPRLADEIRHFGTPCGEHVGVMPYAKWQQAFDPLLTAGARNYWKSHNLGTLPDGLLDTLIEFAGQVPSPQCEIFIGQIDGQVGRIAADATAYPSRDARFVLNVHARWISPDDDMRCIAWARDFFKATAPFAQGSVYVNFMTQDETGRIEAAYGRNIQRLTAVKSHYDPENLFHHNQNIRPTPS